MLQVGLVNRSSSSVAPQRVIDPVQSDVHTCCACGLKTELEKIKEDIMQAVRAELQAAQEREISKFVDVMRGELETFKVDILKELKKGKGVESSSKHPTVDHAKISEGGDDSNEELRGDLDLGSTDGDASYDIEDELDSGEETPEEFLPPMAKSTNDVGPSDVTDKVGPLLDNEATVPSPEKGTPATLSGFNSAYQKAEMIFRKSNGRVVGPFALPSPVDPKDFKLAQFIFNDQLLQW